MLRRVRLSVFRHDTATFVDALAVALVLVLASALVFAILCSAARTVG